MSGYGEEGHPDPRWQRNIAAVAEWDESRWSAWFLAAAADRDFEPIEIHPQARLTAEVGKCYRGVREKSRLAMRRGIVDALRTWTLDAYGFAVLNQLCWVAGKVRATEAIPVLLHILQDHRDLLAEDRKALSAADNLIAIVGGFPPDGAVEDVFSDLLFDDSTPAELTSLLAITIAGAHPHRFAQCLDRFAERSECAPKDFFNHSSVVKSFAAAVPATAIEKGLKEATPRAWVYWMVYGAGEVLDRAKIFGFDVEERSDIKDEALAAPQERTFDVLSEMYECIESVAAIPKVDTDMPPDTGLTVVKSQEIDADNLLRDEGADSWESEDARVA